MNVRYNMPDKSGETEVTPTGDASPSPAPPSLPFGLSSELLILGLVVLLVVMRR